MPSTSLTNSERTRAVRGMPASVATGRSATSRPIAGQDVALPRHHHHRVAAAHEEAIAGVAQAARVVGAGSIVEELQAALIAAVGKLQQHRSVAPCRINGTQQEEVQREADQPVPAARCEGDVDHLAVGGCNVVNCEVGPTSMRS